MIRRLYLLHRPLCRVLHRPLAGGVAVIMTAYQFILCAAFVIILALIYLLTWALCRAAAIADRRTEQLHNGDESWHDNSSGAAEDWHNQR